MGTTTRLTFEEFEKLPEQEGRHYELDEGELVMEPSPTFLHNRIRYRIARLLTEYVERRQSGEIIEEMDFRLGRDTVRNPDVAFVTAGHLKRIDVNRSPVDGAPALAIEVISPTNSAEETAKKTRQYLRAGCQSVWIVYPALRMVEVHSFKGVRRIEGPEMLQDEKVLPGFSIKLSAIFEGKQAKS
jgi:Uma2 family endonuclease